MSNKSMNIKWESYVLQEELPHSWRRSRACCRDRCIFFFETILYSRQSSAKSLAVEEIRDGRSFIYISNRRGPSTVSCGTPEVTAEDDMVLQLGSSRSLWCACPGFHSSANLWWDTLSNAVLKRNLGGWPGNQTFRHQDVSVLDVSAPDRHFGFPWHRI